MRQFVDRLRDEFSFGLSVPAILWQVLFLGVPFCIVAYVSLYVGQGAPWYALTLEHFFALITSAHAMILLRTVLVAFVVATLCVIIAFPVSYFIALHVTPLYKNILLFFLTLPFWTNFLIQVYSWFFLLEKYGLINMFLLKVGIVSEPLTMIYNMFAIIIVTIYCYLPFVLLPLYSTMEKIETELFDASMDLGASWWQTFYRIAIPLSWSGVKVGFLLVFVPVFGEFAIPEIIGGAKYMFVGSLITYYFMVVRDTALGASFTMTSLGFLALSVVILYCVIALFKSKIKRIGL